MAEQGEFGSMVINIEGDVDSITQNDSGAFVNNEPVNNLGRVELKIDKVKYIGRVGENTTTKASTVEIEKCKSCNYEVYDPKALVVIKNINCTVKVFTSDKTKIDMFVSGSSNVMTNVTFHPLEEYKEQ